MSRRDKDDHLLRDIYQLVSRSHWAVGVFLAIAAFFFFHHFTGSAVASLHNGSVNFIELILRAVAPWAQWLATGSLLIAAIESATKNASSSRMLQDARENPAGYLAELEWQEFETLLAAYFRGQGFTVKETGGDGRPDGGVDLELRQGSELTLVQCKHWKAFKVPVTVVRELYGVMAARRADHGIVVCSGEATAAALEFTSGLNIRVLAGKDLANALRRPALQPPHHDSRNPSIVVGVIGLLVVGWLTYEIMKPAHRPELSKTSASDRIKQPSTQIITASPRRPAYVAPSADPYGHPWPTSYGYIKGYAVDSAGGNVDVLVDNAAGTSDVLVDLIDLSTDPIHVARVAFVQSGSRFKFKDVSARICELYFERKSTGQFFKTGLLALAKAAPGATVTADISGATPIRGTEPITDEEFLRGPVGFK